MAAHGVIYLQSGNWVSRLWGQLRMAGLGAYANNCFGIAKGAAYSGLLSFFPLLTTVAAILVQARADDVSHTVAAFLYEVVPPGTEGVVRTAFVAHGQRPMYLLVVAVLLAAWAASGVMMSLMEGFRSIYHVPSGRGFVRDRSMAILLVFIAVLPLWGASALIVFGQRLEHYATGLLAAGAGTNPVNDWLVLAGQLLRYGVALGAVICGTAFVYYLGPNRKQSLRGVFPGAALASVLWLLATLASGWYVKHVANYNVLYGSVGAGLALLVWMYVLAVVMLFGCEFNAARETARLNS